MNITAISARSDLPDYVDFPAILLLTQAQIDCASRKLRDRVNVGLQKRRIDEAEEVHRRDHSSPPRCRYAVEHVRAKLGVSERRARKVLGQDRATQRYCPAFRDNEAPLVRRVIEKATVFSRYRSPTTTLMLMRTLYR